ncbi:hypothetical protein DGMP_19360 [Desulfomarina profundi]|uniref:Uncharacterized protein n=1 Tax=Desulfomarina profundi TaxID=2772557 RepID=A0A8D5FH51_9BACT|nr:hypothetical protein [Desulfomarina profundi]BCL61243.1 hypothetical protein DGMP_19360 [Desulfomarina profundi]
MASLHLRLTAGTGKRTVCNSTCRNHLFLKIYLEKSFSLTGAAFLVILPLLFFPLQVNAAKSFQPAKLSTKDNILQLSPGTSGATLARIKNTDYVRLPSGRIIQMKHIRDAAKLSKRLHNISIKKSSLPASLRLKPAATGGIPVKNIYELSTVLETAKDGDTIQLPSGRRVTAAQLRFIQPELEKRLGKKLSQFKQKNKGAKSIKIIASTEKQYWEKILKKPDDTVLETEDGKFFTVGELKKTLSRGYLTMKPSANTSKKEVHND